MRPWSELGSCRVASIVEMTFKTEAKNSVGSAEQCAAPVATPLVPDTGVIAFVPEAWGGAWASRHQVLTRLSRYFNVVWFNPITRGWRESWFGGPGSERPQPAGHDAPPGFMVYDQSRLYPIIYKPRFLGDFTAARRLRQARLMLRKRGCTKTILYLWRPDFAPYLDLMPHQFSCYHIDDEYTFTPEERATEDVETRLIMRVDQVFIHSQALMEKKGGVNPNTMLVPNGVDFVAFSTPAPEPGDLRTIPHPRIGYIGYIKRQLDFELLLELSRRHPEWSFVYVGPCRKLWECSGQAEELFGASNVYYLGEKAVAELPSYTQHLDVCMMCYKVNDYTKFIYPLKLHEYLAAGRPVVGSPIRSVQEFGDVVTIAATPDQWSQAIQAGLSEAATSRAETEKRQAVARAHDWDGFVKTIARTICARVSPGQLGRIETA